jgi:arylsulfatase A-like enzyme
MASSPGRRAGRAVRLLAGSFTPGGVMTVSRCTARVGLGYRSRRRGKQMADQAKPNIVFLLCDNTGWGDFSCYGGGTPTPRIDQLAAEGIRFNNYTVEAQCTPTRSAILTGRQSVRSGTYSAPPPGSGPNGLAPWEYTIANLLSDAGYATALWGKWHLGEDEGRLPTDQGFDEWWGYRNSADECGWTSYATFDAIAKAAGIQPPQIWEGKKGGKQTAVRPMNMEVRPLLDELIVGKATDYIKRCAAAGKPFYTYIGLSHMHPPEKVHPDFDQTDPTRLGVYADLLAEMDHRVGQIVDCVDEAGIAGDTIIVFSSDNAAGDIDVGIVGGSNGPFRGSFMTPGWEGSMRVPAMVRWPGKVPAGAVTEQMLSAHDWYKTFAALAGASDKVPTDRPMDGVDASQFLLGQSQKTGRQNLLFFGPDGSLMTVKWSTMKVILRYCNGIDQPIVKPQFPMFFDLGSDPGELYNLMDYKLDMTWMFGLAFAAIGEYEKSLAKYPNIPVGADFKGY